MIFAWVSLFFFFSHPAMADLELRCDRAYGQVARGAEAKTAALQARGLVYDRLREIDRNLALAFNHIHLLEPDLVSGKAIPKWDDLSLLDSILLDLKLGKSNAAASGKLEELGKVIPHLIEHAKQDENLLKLSAAGNLKGAKAEGYQPTEYELKRLYQYKLWEINKELPPSLKIRGSRIPFDQRRNRLVAEARALIKAQEEKYQTLYPTTSFPNREALVRAIKQESPEAKAILDMVEKEEVDFVMRRPERGRWWIQRVGFQNQRISRTSQGFNSPDARDNAEAFLTFGKRSGYEKLDNDLKPKYGYLRPKPGQPLVEERQSTSQYGEDFYILKKDHLRNRTTWTAGDSLGRGYVMGEANVPGDWQEAFTPWSNRELMVPVVVPKKIAEDNTFRVQRPFFEDPSPLKDFPKSLLNDRYVEMQYWGPVTLDDVEAFEFSKAPPFGEFLEELLKRKIKIRDARLGPPKDWTPESEAAR